MKADGKALSAALGFTPADLEANRLGALSHSQMERMRAIRQRNTLVASAFFAALVLGATVLFYLGQLNRSLILFGAGLALTLFNAVAVGRAGRAYMRIGGDLRAGQVEVLCGAVERVLRRGRASDGFMLRINGVELHVTKDVFMGFRHMAPYRIYRAGISRVLLSAEREA